MRPESFLWPEIARACAIGATASPVVVGLLAVAGEWLLALAAAAVGVAAFVLHDLARREAQR